MTKADINSDEENKADKDFQYKVVDNQDEMNGSSKNVSLEEDEKYASMYD